MIFGRKKKEPVQVQTAVSDGYRSGLLLMGSSGDDRCEWHLYRSLRENVPLVDAAIGKLVRLTGTFGVECEDKELQEEINDFLRRVRVNGNQQGADSFLATYLDQLLTYGTAVGEVVPDKSGRRIAALYNASLDDVELRAEKDPFDITFMTNSISGEMVKVRYPELILCTTIMNRPGKVYGTSVLRGLPFVGDMMMKIFNAVGTNWDRVGNVRFAVSYKPGENERSFTKERAALIASEWSKAMKSREPRDFVTVGDVNIRVIGAENQIPDCEIPLKMLMQQIIAKLSIPPFLLGLSWSTTERMSVQQADILTSELDFYRGQLEGCIRKICDLYLRFRGSKIKYGIRWNCVNLQDEVELARARLYNAQASSLEDKEEE
ncbi:MAG: serine/threonine protein phosphatase [Clostridia bacterium]|nr:serine/threonine protein phosphatase [Clostridia bacterium]